MPMVNKVRKARKAQGNCRRCGYKIKVGDSYYWYKFRYGGKYVHCRSHYPKSSELTQSDKLARLYEIQETIEDAAEISEAAAIEDLAGVLDQAAQDARDVGDEYRDSAAAIEQAFYSSPTADECNEKADSCDSWADELESAASDVREIAGRVPEETPDPDESEDAEDAEGDETGDDSAEDAEKSEDEMMLVQEAIDRAIEASGALEL